MKVIDLLNKIANGEDIPKKIKYYNNIYKYNQNDVRYHNIELKRVDLSSKLGDYNFNYLNDEVEIIEEDKKIEKCKGYECFECLDDYIEHLRHKIDELIEEIEKLKGKSE